MSTFKAKNFRFTKSTQYADQLWLKTMGTIATAYTYGQSDSLRVAYLAEDSTAVPAVFGSMSWTAPLEAPTRCTINLLDGSDMVVGMTIEPHQTTVTGLTANGSVTLPNLPTLSTGTVVSYDPATGVVGYADTGNVAASNVSANIVSATTVGASDWVQLGSGSELWRLRPNADSGLLVVEKLEGGEWVAKSVLGA